MRQCKDCNGPVPKRFRRCRACADKLCIHCTRPRDGDNQQCVRCAEYQLAFERRTRAAKKVQGVCVSKGCSGPANPGRTMCEACRVRHNAIVKAARDRRKGIDPRRYRQVLDDYDAEL